MKALWRLENGGIRFELTAEGKNALQGRKGDKEHGRKGAGAALSSLVIRHSELVTNMTDRAKMGDG